MNFPTMPNLQACAHACATAYHVDCRFFAYEPSSGGCAAQMTQSASCTEGFVIQAGRNFYQLAPQPVPSAGGGGGGGDGISGGLVFLFLLVGAVLGVGITSFWVNYRLQAGLPPLPYAKNMSSTMPRNERPNMALVASARATIQPSEYTAPVAPSAVDGTRSAV